MGVRNMEFLIKDLLILAWNASVQRTKVYREGSGERDRREFRHEVLNHLVNKIVPDYESSTPGDDEHCDRIEELQSYVEQEHGHLLNDGEYRYGVAQKLLNLTLKYYWSLGLIAEPPHCPVDRMILERTDLKQANHSWTKWRTRDEYMNAINAIRQEAKASERSIAQWELRDYEQVGGRNLNLWPMK